MAQIEPRSGGLLRGQRALVVGVANKYSIAWGAVRALAREGADLAITYHSDRSFRRLEQLVPDLGVPVQLFPLDVSDPASMANFAAQLAEHWPQVDLVFHSIASAKPGDLAGRFSDTELDGWRLALEVSAFSLTALVRALKPLLVGHGGSTVVACTYLGSERVLPNYNVMGVAKAALEASVRYLAHDLGPDGVRVNAVSAGPVKTLSMHGVKGAADALRHVVERAPLRRNITSEDVGNAVVFLGSPWAENITGQVLFVDAGYHVMGV